MARKKKSQFQLGDTTKKFLDEVSAILIERGAKEIDLAPLLDSIVSKRNSKDVDDFVSKNTPFEFKLKKLMEDDKTLNEINKLADKYHFGLTSAL